MRAVALDGFDVDLVFGRLSGWTGCRCLGLSGLDLFTSGGEGFLRPDFDGFTCGAESDVIARSRGSMGTESPDLPFGGLVETSAAL